jgi:cytochrome c553
MWFCLRPSAKVAVFGACLAISFAAQGRAHAQGDAKAGRQKAESVCGVCHGVDGLAKIPEAPNLAGQSEGYLIEQITAFKSGERKNEMMSVVVQDLSPTDIENLAAYYSGIEISVGKTPGQ